MENPEFERLADYFALVGINKEFLPNSSDSEGEQKITSLALFYGYLNAEATTLGNQNEKWLDIDGSKSLWLKITFNEDKAAITKFGIYKIPINSRGRIVII